MNVSEMTDEMLNEAIVLKRGWAKLETHINYPIELWKNKYGLTLLRSQIPDYCTSWQWAGELLEEMPFNTKLINYEDEVNGRQFWTCSVTQHYVYGRELAYAISSSPTRAISEAWYEVNK